MKWLHDINTMTLRKYAIIDRTGDIRLLRKWWNIFPIGWFDTEAFFAEYNEIFNVTIKKSDKVYQIIAYNKLLMLDKMLVIMSVIMRNQNDRSIFALIFKKEVKEYKGNMAIYQEKVKAITGIEVVDGKGLDKLKKETERLTEKYLERFKKTDINVQTGLTFMDLVLGVFGDKNYQPDMTLAEFGRLKVMTDKRILQQNEQYNRNNK